MVAPDPSRYFEFSLTDRAMAVVHEESPFTPQLGMEFDSLLDHARLGRALELLARRHPILSATVDPLTTPARWQPGTTTPELVEVVETAGDRAGSQQSATAPLWSHALDPTSGPTCQVAHVHDGLRSRIVFEVHHAAVDGRAMLLALDDLGAIYDALQRDVEPLVDVDWNPRTVGALLDANGVTVDERLRESWDLVQRWGQLPRSTHRDVPNDGDGATSAPLTDATMGFDDALVGAVDAGARSHGWRLNHVVLALLARAWSRVVGREPGEPSVSGWLVTVDCRRQFRVERGAGNLSGLEPVSVLDVESADLFDVIEAVRAAFAPFTRSGAGLAADLASPMARVTPPLILDRAIRDTFALRTRTRRYSRLYTHTDRLSASLTHWGDASGTSLSWLPPRRVTPPYVGFALLRFGGATSLTPIASTEMLPAACAAAIAVELQAGFEELDARL